MYKRCELAAVLFAIPLLGCVGDLEPKQGTGSAPLDEAEVLSMAATYRDATQFDRVSGGSYPSALGTASYIELYANRTAAAQYELVAPENTGSNAKIPVGGIIVREVLDASGTAQRLTIMAKGPAGYNPTIGDWFWAVTDLQGVPIMESGIPRSGQLADCYGCHIPRASDDFLFGVPMIDRSGLTGAGSGSGSGSDAPQGGTMAVCGDFACEGTETKETCSQDCNHGHTK
jgi:hypothetical protein